MHKDGTRFPVLIIEAPLINAQGEQTGWMSAFLDIREQRRVEELSRASQERLQGHGPPGHGGRDGFAAEPRTQPAPGGYRKLCHWHPEPAGPGSRPARPTSGWPCTAWPSRPNAPASVIKSVHDFVRRRDQAREAVAAAGFADRCHPGLWSTCRHASSAVQRAAPRLAPRPACLCSATAPWLSRCCSTWRAMACRPWTAYPLAERELVLRVLPAGSREGATRPDGWLEFSVADCGNGIAPAVAERLFTAVLHHQARGHGPGPVAVPHGGRAARRRADLRGAPAARHGVPLHAADRGRAENRAFPGAFTCNLLRTPWSMWSTMTPVCAMRCPGCCARGA